MATWADLITHFILAKERKQIKKWEERHAHQEALARKEVLSPGMLKKHMDFFLHQYTDVPDSSRIFHHEKSPIDTELDSLLLKHMAEAIYVWATDFGACFWTTRTVFKFHPHRTGSIDAALWYLDTPNKLDLVFNTWGPPVFIRAQYEPDKVWKAKTCQPRVSYYCLLAYFRGLEFWKDENTQRELWEVQKPWQ